MAQFGIPDRVGYHSTVNEEFVRNGIAEYEIAEGHLSTDVPVADTTSRISDTIRTLRRFKHQPSEYVYIVDANRRLVGKVKIVDLFAENNEEKPVSTLMSPVPESVLPETDQEHVATTALNHQLSAVPVVDQQGVFLGIVPAFSIIEILRKEHVEDLQRMTGILRGTKAAWEAIEEPALKRAKGRLPWLILGLFGSAMGTSIISGFESLLAENVAIAFFIPAVVYLADAVGTQTEAVVIRGLSLSRTPAHKIFIGELRTGLLIAMVLGIMTYFAVLTVFTSRLALVVSLAVATAGATASAVGFFFPLLLDRLGKDPAFGSGPVATVVQDTLSVAIYLVLASILL